MVPTETDFIQIAWKMFAAHIVKYTQFGSFQKSAGKGGVKMEMVAV